MPLTLTLSAASRTLSAVNFLGFLLFVGAGMTAL